MAERRWTIIGCSICGFEKLERATPQGGGLDHAVHEGKKEAGEFKTEVVPASELQALQQRLEEVGAEKDRLVLLGRQEVARRMDAERERDPLREALDRLLATGPLANPADRAYIRAQEDAADLLSTQQTAPDHGSGERCATCGGRGQRIEIVPGGPAPEQSYVFKCPDCNGTGEQQGEGAAGG